jgi:hypothetical protein
MLAHFLLSLLLALAPARTDTTRAMVEHVPTASVQCAAWVPAGAVVALTAESGDTYVFARDARTVLESGYYGLGTASADKELCGGHWMSGGVVVEITIPKKLGESQDEWLDRCKQAIEKAKVQFPPEP